MLLCSFYDLGLGLQKARFLDARTEGEHKHRLALGNAYYADKPGRVKVIGKAMRRDRQKKAAAIKAMGQVTGPIIATTLVLFAVFIPVGFMPGIAVGVLQWLVSGRFRRLYDAQWPSTAVPAASTATGTRSTISVRVASCAASSGAGSAISGAPFASSR